MTRDAYENLVSHLGVDLEGPPKILRKSLQIVDIDEAVLKLLNIDTRGLHMNPYDESAFQVISDDSYVDEWGITYRAARSQGRLMYFDIADYPLRNATSIGDLEKHSWPVWDGQSRASELGDRAKHLRENTQYALIGHVQGIFELNWCLRSMDKYFVDLMKNKTFAHTLMQRVFDVQMSKMTDFLDQVGQYLDVVSTADDLSSQQGPLISPDLYREMIKPYHKKFYTLIKEKTQAKLLMHSCGSTVAFFDDFLDLGVDIINPVQVTAAGMDPVSLKTRYGKRLCFWGGVDSQRLLPTGTPGDIRAEVRRLIQVLGREGGYVPCAVHNIQADVPPENVLALYETAAACE